MQDKWITPPPETQPQWDHEGVEKGVEMWHIILKRAIHTGDLKTCRKALELLRTYRKMGLKTPEGEFSTPNLVYKSLRNDHTLQAITLLINRLHDQDLSLD